MTLRDYDTVKGQGSFEDDNLNSGAEKINQPRKQKTGNEGALDIIKRRNPIDVQN
jgi:hypothetical protein